MDEFEEDGGKLDIRDAVGEDLGQVTDIYNHIVRTSTAIYNDTPTTLEERISWWRERQEKQFPVLVAVEGETLLGFASLGPFRSWPGYRFTVEGTVHVGSSFRGRGIGKRLLQALVARASAMGKHSIVAAVDSENTTSLLFLEHFGFHRVAYLCEVGFKFDRFRDLILLQYWISPPCRKEVDPPQPG